jgi:DNA polymerase delta subunit 2
METASGDFEVIDICYAGLPPLAAPASDPSNQIPEKVPETKPAVKGKGKAKQEPVKKAPEPEKKVPEKTRMDIDGEEDAKVDMEPKWVALISGVSAGSAEVPEDLKTILLVEWLTGEGGGTEVSLFQNSWGRELTSAALGPA